MRGEEPWGADQGVGERVGTMECSTSFLVCVFFNMSRAKSPFGFPMLFLKTEDFKPQCYCTVLKQVGMINLFELTGKTEK